MAKEDVKKKATELVETEVSQDQPVEITSQPVIMQPTQTAVPWKKNIPWLIAAGAVLLVLLCGTFMLGRMTGNANRNTRFTPGNDQFNTSSRRGMPGGMGMNGGGYRRMGTTGTVTAVSATSLTVKDNAGESKTFAIDSSTQIVKNGATAVVGDIMTGAIVMVRTNDTSATPPIASVLSIRSTAQTN